MFSVVYSGVENQGEAVNGLVEVYGNARFSTHRCGNLTYRLNARGSTNSA